MKLHLLMVDPPAHLGWGLTEDDKVVKFTVEHEGDMDRYADLLARNQLVDVDIEDYRVLSVASPPTRQG